jgi:hypothetical protein
MTAASFFWFPSRRRALGPFLAVLLGTAGAGASPPRDVVVSLEDGTTARGRLAEIVPGTRCVLVLSTGERRTIAWASVQRIDDAADRPEPEPPPMASTLPAAPARDESVDGEPSPGKTTIVSMDASSSVELQRETSDGKWVAACRAPCDLALPVDASYRVVVDGRPISTLRLSPEGAPRVVLDVSLARPGLRAFGGILTGLAGIALYGALAVGSDQDSTNDDSTTPLALTGVIGLAIGIPLLVANRGSDAVVQRPARAPGATRWERDVIPRRQAVGPSLGPTRSTSILTLQF